MSGMGERAYLGEPAEDVQSQVVELRSKALELFVRVDVLGRDLGEQSDGLLERRIVGAILELDNVLARDEIDAEGLDDGSTPVKGTGGGGGSECQRQQGQERRSIHHLGAWKKEWELGYGEEVRREGEMVGCSSSLDSMLQERDADIYLNIKPS